MCVKYIPRGIIYRWLVTYVSAGEIGFEEVVPVFERPQPSITKNEKVQPQATPQQRRLIGQNDQSLYIACISRIPNYNHSVIVDCHILAVNYRRRKVVS